MERAFRIICCILAAVTIAYATSNDGDQIERDGTVSNIAQRKLLQCTPDIERLKTSGGGCCTSADCAKYPLVKLQSDEYWSCEASANKNLGNRCYARQKAKDKKKKCGVDKSLGCGPTEDDFALCENGIKDADEGDIDCGGKACDKCEAGQRCKNRDDCAATMDCKGGFCDAKKCSSDNMCYFSKKCLKEKQFPKTPNIGLCAEPSCSDGIKNGYEGGVDCGGPDCKGCKDGASCQLDFHCESKICKKGKCQAPTCDDGVKNGAEGGVDCGGPCKNRCGKGDNCKSNGDCAGELGCSKKGICSDPSCSDGKQNGGEWGVDCGKVCNKPCQQGAYCEKDEHCKAARCKKNKCQGATCDDGIQNGREIAVDCGGGDCPGCPNSTVCTRPDDCKSLSCQKWNGQYNMNQQMKGECKPATCSDKWPNQDETDFDCGGNVCPKCAAGKRCKKDSDCLTGSCKFDDKEKYYKCAAVRNKPPKSPPVPSPPQSSPPGPSSPGPSPPGPSPPGPSPPGPSPPGPSPPTAGTKLYIAPVGGIGQFDSRKILTCTFPDVKNVLEGDDCVLTSIPGIPTTKDDNPVQSLTSGIAKGGSSLYITDGGTLAVRKCDTALTSCSKVVEDLNDSPTNIFKSGLSVYYANRNNTVVVCNEDLANCNSFNPSTIFKKPRNLFVGTDKIYVTNERRGTDDMGDEFTDTFVTVCQKDLTSCTKAEFTFPTGAIIFGVTRLGDTVYVSTIRDATADDPNPSHDKIYKCNAAVSSCDPASATVEFPMSMITYEGKLYVAGAYLGSDGKDILLYRCNDAVDACTEIRIKGYGYHLITQMVV